jgi:hypothetical protein
VDTGDQEGVEQGNERELGIHRQSRIISKFKQERELAGSYVTII